MKLSKDKPKEPGWYWWAPYEGGEGLARPVYVGGIGYDHGPNLLVKDEAFNCFGCDQATLNAASNWTPVGNVQGLWAGPIKRPVSACKILSRKYNRVLRKVSRGFLWLLNQLTFARKPSSIRVSFLTQQMQSSNCQNGDTQSCSLETQKQDTQ